MIHHASQTEAAACSTPVQPAAVGRLQAEDGWIGMTWAARPGPVRLSSVHFSLFF